MKKILTLVLALALSITALSGCGSKPAADKTPEELAELYSSAIMENGGEMAEYNPAFTQAKDDDGSAMVLENMGLNTEDMAAFGISASLMKIKAYAIAAIMPAEGKEAAVMEALQGYIDRTRWLRTPDWRLWRTARSCWSCARTRIRSLTPSLTPPKPTKFKNAQGPPS